MPHSPGLLTVLTVLTMFSAPGAGGAAEESRSMESLVTACAADWRSVEAAYNVPWSEAVIRRREELSGEWRRRLEAVAYESLAPAARIDWHLLASHLHGQQAAARLERQRLAEMEPLLPFRRPVQELLGRREERQDTDPRHAAEVLAQALTEVKSLRRKLEEGRAKEAPETALKPGPVTAVRTASALEEFRRALDSWFQFYDGFQPDFSWWVRQPVTALEKELEETARFLRQDIAGVKGAPEDPLIGDPVGAEALAEQIAGEMIPCTAAELLALAEKEMTWCVEELRKAAAAMGCEDGKEALAKIKERHAPVGGQAALAAEKAGKAIRFVKEKDLISVPSLAEETWRLSMIGVEQQKSLPYAVYSDPGMLVAFAHESMPQEEKLMSMRGNNAAFLHIVTPHELIPGHHLQGFMAKREAVHRQLFRTPFFVEGWALHWEMLLWDLGYAATPEEKTGALFWRMHRCARIIVSLKFHLGEMTPAAMVDYLVDRVGHERAGAAAEVRRYIGGSYPPLYQAAYMLGGLQLRALCQELTGGPAPRMSLREFHDTVLRQNAIPMEMVRAALTGAVLPRDWRPSWKFNLAQPR